MASGLSNVRPLTPDELRILHESIGIEIPTIHPFRLHQGVVLAFPTPAPKLHPSPPRDAG
jgi:hypothetical protein